MKSFPISRTVVNKILTQAQHNIEVEICGLIGGRDKRPETVYPVPNIACDQTRLFEMDPARQIEAMREMREAGEQLLAIYHSHPTAPARPSLKDIHDAAYKEVVYLIVSLSTEGVLEMRGFFIRDDVTEEIELSLE
ncbi:MAG: M67 family metallopeptidase [Gammaproteobacteria bacterium]|nr:M67 family metallopeptidase [Gammaproteobacteria bacterium]